MRTIIEAIKAREVLDSRGNPTVEVELHTPDLVTRAIVPSGASTGSKEALELRDNDGRFNGKGVLKAVHNANGEIAEKIKGMDCKEQEMIDKAMIDPDGTENKSRLGANAMLAVSMAVCKAGAYGQQKSPFQHIAALANTKRVSIPLTFMNVMNGGRHAGREHDIQEHLFVPVNFDNYPDALRAGVESYHMLKKLFKMRFGARGTLLGDEGGFVPELTFQERLDFMLDAIDEAGYGGKIKLAIDAASSEFFKDGVYQIEDQKFTSGELVDYYKDLISAYPVVSIEDGMEENDWQGWIQLTSALGNKVQVMGDDLLVTNPKIIQEAIEKNAVNALLVKVNQIGTVTETISATKMAQEQGWGIQVSNRSGETEDSFIADLAVGLNAGQSKFCAPARAERTAKYNELLRINEKLGGAARFAGKDFNF
ncbi:MAG: phosphopyruvate hydratase [Nanoarchaeota archaeon]